MRKYYLLSAVMLLLTGVSYAQHTVSDSLKVKRLLEDTREVKLNPEAAKMIDFGSGAGSPRVSGEKNWMLPDETLPQALPKPKVVLSLMPYKANTAYNWDPVYQKKIRVDKDTWRGDPFYVLRRQRSYTNSDSKEQDVAMDMRWQGGARTQLFGERANGSMVSTMTTGKALPLYTKGSTKVTISGGNIGGLDLMAVFTKNFWDKAGRRQRERTLEVLRAYGDSTSVMINVPLEQITP